MKAPRIPPMLSTIVQTGIVAVDDVTFGELAACPFCGGPVSGYDTKKKVFAIIREGDEERTIRVSVKRFFCRACDRIINADEPFYPGTRIGSPVIDLCLSLATTMPVNRTAAWLDAMGDCRRPDQLPAVRPGTCPCGPHHRSLWYQAADLGGLTLNPCHPDRTTESRQRSRSSRSL